MTERNSTRLDQPLTEGRFLTEDLQYAHLSGLELARRGIETERLEHISVNRIVLEGSITDERHIDRLAKSMRGRRGQISPVTLRARDVGLDYLHYDTIDGFHRVPALIKIQKEFAEKGIKRDSAKSVVMYGCSDEEMFDLRVLAASSVRSVQFARVARWMQYSFAQTKWAKELSLSQAFSLEVNDTKRARRLGLTSQETTDVREWARTKAQLWQKPVTTIWQDLRAIDAAAPDLLLRVRVGGGGKRSKRGELSPARFRAIVFPLAGEHELQRLVARVVARDNLVANDAGLLAREIAKVKDDPKRVDQMLQNSDLVVGKYQPGWTPDKHRSFLTISERELERRVNTAVGRHSLRGSEILDLTSLVEAAYEGGDEKKLDLLLEDPRFFVGQVQEPSLDIGKLSGSDEETLFMSEKDSEAEPTVPIYEDDSLKDLSVGELTQKMHNYRNIIKKQDGTIRELEARLARVDDSSDDQPTIVGLLQRTWGCVQFDILTGEVGCEEVGFKKLSPIERNILNALIRYQGIPLDKDTILRLSTLEGSPLPQDRKLLWTNISRIRTKLRGISPLLSDKLTTVQGYGYMWR